MCVFNTRIGFSNDTNNETNAVDACSKEYGLLATFSAFMFIVFGFFQLFRLALYLALVVYHHKVLGNWEAATRKNSINRQLNQPIELNFEISTFVGIQEGKDEMCSICCVNFK